MISLEGLTLATGRHAEAGYILRTFAHYVRDGLIPNLFPEGEQRGAVPHRRRDALVLPRPRPLPRGHRRPRDAARSCCRTLLDIVEHHLRGTRFGIGVDPADGLLRQGAEGYQLTWMDAKVDDWVVTPRRGKAVEINALWYNALRLLERLARARSAATTARRRADRRTPSRRRASFNRRFWYAEGGYLYDVVDGETAATTRPAGPNQVFAISLPHPVLDRDALGSRCSTSCSERLLTPVGLRSLAPGPSRLQAAATTATCARATRPTTRARSGAG